MALDAMRSQFEACQSEMQRQKLEIQTLTVKTESKGSEVDSLRLELCLANGELQKVQTVSASRTDLLRKQVSN